MGMSFMFNFALLSGSYVELNNIVFVGSVMLYNVIGVCISVSSPVLFLCTNIYTYIHSVVFPSSMFISLSIILYVSHCLSAYLAINHELGDCNGYSNESKAHGNTLSKFIAF